MTKIPEDRRPAAPRRAGLGMRPSWLSSFSQTVDRTALASIALYTLYWFLIVIGQERLGTTILFGWLLVVSPMILLLGAWLSARAGFRAMLARVLAAFGFWIMLWIATLFSLILHIADSKPKFGAELAIIYLICALIFVLFVKGSSNALVGALDED